jgi:hypothetical protein
MQCGIWPWVVDNCTIDVGSGADTTAETEYAAGCAFAFSLWLSPSTSWIVSLSSSTSAAVASRAGRM